jgi:hypothetical protein
LAGNNDLIREFEKYVKSLEQPEITINETIWEKFATSQSKEQREVVQQLNLKEMIEEQINQRLGNWKPTYEEEMAEEETEIITEETQAEEKPTPISSRYGKVFDNLSKEDAEKKEKKWNTKNLKKNLGN